MAPRRPATVAALAPALAPHRAGVRGGDPALAPHRAGVRGGDPALAPHRAGVRGGDPALRVPLLTASSCGLSCVRRSSLLIRLRPALFEVLFPVLRPGTAEVIDVAGIARQQLGRPAVGPVHDRAANPAFDEREPLLRIVEARPQLPWRYRMQRPEKCLGV